MIVQRTASYQLHCPDLLGELLCPAGRQPCQEQNGYYDETEDLLLVLALSVCFTHFVGL